MQVAVSVEQLLFGESHAPLSIGQRVHSVIFIYVILRLVHVTNSMFREFGSGCRQALLGEDGLLYVLL